MSIKGIVRKFIPIPLLEAYHYAMAFLGALLYAFPSKKLIVIGVTGTSGKSTTLDFIARIFQEAEIKTASVSSVRFKIGEKEWKNELKMTMPGRFKMQKFLRQAVQENCKYAVLEVTSEGIRQHRHEFINFDTAVFTNLSMEHVESHGSFENYRNEKLKLFRVAKNVHVINSEDENTEYFMRIPAHKKITFGWEQGDVNLKNTPFTLKLLGGFNNYNALAAIAVAMQYGISLEHCQNALKKVQGIPGRMEIVSQNPLIVVDYAHTPDQLEKVYKTLSGKGNLIAVLGSCGGGRDKWKRPVLGKIASQYCKEIIITNEDPYDEDPNQILSEIKSGIINTQFPISNFYEILDRKEAIKKAIGLAKPEDTVIITGKGSEVWMCLENGKKIPWDDRQIVKITLGLDNED